MDGEKTKSGAAGKDTAPKVDTRTLFRNEREIILIHGCDEYRLHITHAGKLILTK